MWLHLTWPCLCWVGLHEWVIGVEFTKSGRLKYDRGYQCNICEKKKPSAGNSHSG